MEKRRMITYVIKEKKTAYVFAWAKSVEYLKEGRTEYSINDKVVDKDAFIGWIEGFYRLPDEVTTIDYWEV